MSERKFPDKEMETKMSVVFLHPDLGIGGAERLVIDAALALKSSGHSVKFVTNHYDPSHCFAETKTGEISVSVSGSWFPRSIFGRCYAGCAYARMIIAAICLCICERPDIVFCDQVAACNPIIRLLRPSTKIIFYCHFPDMLLTGRETFLKSIYRWPLDWLEEYSTGFAHRILVNSQFTCGVFRKIFKSLRDVPVQVLYPTLHTDSFDAQLTDCEICWPPDREFIFLSINRFERKKNIALALHSMSRLRMIVAEHLWAATHLLIAGGYDTRVKENLDHERELEELSERLDIKSHVTFFRSPSDDTKRFLLSRCLALLYTPSEEHFGIVPLEAMYCAKPVIAVNSGGPKETVQDGVCGFLADEGTDFAEPMKTFVEDPAKAEEFGRRGKKRVADKFSFSSFRQQLNEIVNRL